jgi:hypothetical protein
MSRRRYNQLIGIILALGAATFALLLAGVGSSLLTRPPAP